MIQSIHGFLTGSLQDERLAQIVQGIIQRCQEGKATDLEECLKQHPEYEDRLRQLIPAIEAMLDFGDSLPGKASFSSLQGDSLVGELGDFRLIREIGRGGMGVVYEAEQVSLARRVALKVLPFAGMLDPRQLQRFQNEARAAAGLHHPNIVPVHSVGCDRGVHFYAMQYIEGRTLGEVIAELRNQADPKAVNSALSQAAEQLISEEPSPGLKSQGEFEPTVRLDPNAVPPSPSIPDPAFLQAAAATKSLVRISTESANRSKSNLIRGKAYWRNVAQLGIQIAEALDYAHSLGITHRDIKPSNLLLDDRGTVWVADFGLAQVGTEGNLTLTGEMLGTLRYMSPEQATGQKGLLDQRTDIYSLGITLYELLTLEPAFPGTDRKELLHQVLNQELTSPRRHNPAIPRDLETILLKATTKEASGRYRTAREISDDLGRVLNHQPIRAKRPGLLERGIKWSRRHIRAVVVAVLVLILLLGTAAGISLLWYGWERSARADAEGARESSRVLLYVSDMKLVSDAIQNRDCVRAAELLERHIPKKGEKDLRGFEWHYYHKQIHQLEVVALDQGTWVDDVAASPDGKWLATTAASGTVRIYDTATWTLQQSFATSADSVHGVAWSPDSERLAAACGGGHVHVWELSSGVLLFDIPAHAEAANDVVFSPDGTKLYSCGEDRLAKKWDMETGQEQLAFTGHTGVVCAIALSPDGHQLATASGDMSYAIWDTKTAERLQNFNHFPHTGRMGCVAFSPDGRSLATGSELGYVFLTDLKKNAIAKAPQKLDRVDGVLFLEGGRWLATVDFGGAVHLYPTPSEAAPTLPVSTLGWMAHPSPIISLTAIGDGETLITGGRDGMVRVWQPESQATCWDLPIIQVPDYDIGPDNRLYRVHEGIEIWDLDGRKLVDRFAEVGSSWEQIACSQDGRFLTAFRVGQVALYDLTSRQVIREWPIEETIRTGELAISHDGRFVALSASDQEAVTVYDRDPSQSARQFPAKQCNSLAFSPDGRWLATGHSNGVWLFDLQAEEEPRLFAAHSNSLSDFAFSPDSQRLATVSSDRQLKLWELPDGELQFSVVADTDGLRHLTFSPNGKTIATWAALRRINLWHAASGQTLGTLVCQNYIVSKPRFASDSLRLITHERLDSGSQTHFIYDAAPLSNSYVPTRLVSFQNAEDATPFPDGENENTKPEAPVTEPVVPTTEPPAQPDLLPTEPNLIDAIPISGGDYDGDGKTDLAIYTPGTRQFHIDYSGNGSGPIFQTDIQYVYGEAGDYPLAGDYDGDGKSDLAVCKNKTRKFSIDYSGDGFNPNGQADVEYVGGELGDIPLSGDFDGDGKSDLVLYRRTTSNYHIDFSANGFTSGSQAEFIRRFGRVGVGEVPLTGDFDGDGKSDFIVYRPKSGRFFAATLTTLTTIYPTSGSVDLICILGEAGDIPLIGDYDGDRKADFCVYRPTTHRMALVFQEF